MSITKINNMKNIILIIALFSINLISCQIFPLNDKNKSDAPTGSYFKDLNGELDKYIGLWKGNWNGKTVYVELKKVKYQMDDIFIDRIFGERKIVNSTGNIEIDRITNFDNYNPEFRGISKSINPSNRDRLTFYPKNMCRKTAIIDIVNFTGTQMTLHFEYEPSAYDENCIHNAYVQQNGDFPINFPKDVVLTKQ